MNPKVRTTAILIENSHILLAEQKVTKSLSRSWSLPGGTLEFGETLEECIIREVKEETGLDVVVEKLLYVCDRILDERHVVHITFIVKRVGGSLQVGVEPETDANPIKSVKMVPLAELRQYDFSERFCQLAQSGFPNCGTYQGLIHNIGL
jgi:mutator protein MutT